MEKKSLTVALWIGMSWVLAGAVGCIDTDGDGVFDQLDNCPDVANSDQADTDGDGTGDACDDAPPVPSPTQDTDGDLVPDLVDNCPNDPNKTDPGACGCGTADTDSDGDQTPDCNDGCPNDANKTDPGACGCGTADTDSDGDQTPDCKDACPNDASKTSAGTCGCGTRDADTDGDLAADCIDNCPNDDNPGQEDSDGDGAGDVCDLDVDGDGFEGPLGDAQDCDDLDAAVNPGAAEICANDIDDDCDTWIDVEYAAVADQETREGWTVDLLAEQVCGARGGGGLNFLWVQTAGADVDDPTGFNTDSASFKAPVVNTLLEANLTFQLTVDDGLNTITIDEVTVRVWMLGDVDKDDDVDQDDKQIVEDLILAGGTPGPDGEGDLNGDGGDGVVDFRDLTIVLEQDGRVLQIGP